MFHSAIRTIPTVSCKVIYFVDLPGKSLCQEWQPLDGQRGENWWSENAGVSHDSKYLEQLLWTTSAASSPCAGSFLLVILATASHSQAWRRTNGFSPIYIFSR